MGQFRERVTDNLRRREGREREGERKRRREGGREGE